MPEEPDDNPFRVALQAPAVAQPTPAPAEDDNPFRAALDPVKYHVPKVLEQAELNKWDWSRLASGLKEVGANPDDYQHLKSQLDLEQARQKVAATGETTSQAFRRRFMGFGDVVGTNSLPDVPDALNPTIRGKSQFGGDVVGNKEYYDAVKRFKAGEHDGKDLDKIATWEKARDTDARLKKAPFGVKLVTELGGLGKIGSEMMAGAGALNLGARGVLAARGGRAAAAATEGVAGLTPAVPEAASLASRAYQGGKTLAATTAVVPSMYVPLMQEINTRSDRDPNDVKGLPTAFGYGMANLAVLGRLQQGVSAAGPLASFSKGVLGMAELQGVDLAAGTIDQFLPKAFEIHGEDQRWGTIGDLTRGFRKGEGGDALSNATAQALSFAIFARVHGVNPKAPETLLSSYMDAKGKLSKEGFSDADAGKQLAGLHDKLEAALSNEPYLSKEKAREVLAEAASEPLKPYAEKLADVFEPKAKLPEKPSEPKAPEPTPIEPKPAEPKIEPTAPAQVDRPEIRATPEEAQYAPYKEDLQRMVRMGMSEEKAKALVRAAHPESFPEPGQVVAAAATEPARQPNETAATPAEAPGRPATSPVSEVTPGTAKPEIVQPASSQTTKPAAGEPILHVPDYKTPGSNLSAVRKMLLNSFAGKWFSKGHEQNAGYFTDAKFQIELDHSRLRDEAGGDFVENRQKEVGVGSQTPLYLHPALSAIRYRGRADAPEVRELEPVVKEVNEERARAGLDPVKLEATDRRTGVAGEGENLGRRESDKEPPAAAATPAPPPAAIPVVRAGGRLRPVGKGIGDVEALRGEPGRVGTERLVEAGRFKAGGRTLPPEAPKEVSKGAPAVDSTAEIRSKESKLRSSRDYSGFSADEAAGTKAYDKARDAFVDRVLEAAGKENNATVRGELESLAWNTPAGQGAGAGGWKSVAEGRSVTEYGEYLFRSEAALRVAEARRRLAEAGDWFSAKAAKELSDLLPEPEPSSESAAEPAPKVRAGDRKKPTEPPPEATAAMEAALKANDRAAAEKTLEGLSQAQVINLHAKVFPDSPVPKTKRGAVASFLEEFAEPAKPAAAATSAAPMTLEEARGVRDAFAAGKDVDPAVLSEAKRVLDANEKSAEKPVTKPAAAATPDSSRADELVRDQWDSMDVSEKRFVAKDPAMRAFYEGAGIDVVEGVKSAVAANRAGNKKGVTRTSDTELTDEVARVVRESDRLSEDEKVAFEAVVRGQSLRDLVKQHGGTPEGWRKRAARALEKLQKEDTRFAEFDSVQEAIDYYGQQELIRRKESQERQKNPRRLSNEAPDEPEPLYGGAPFRIKFLEGLFGKAGESDTALGSRIRRWFIGDLPAEVRLARSQEIDQRIATHAYDVANAEKDFRRALRESGKNYDSLSEADTRLLDDLLRVPPDETLAAAAARGIAAPVAESIRSMRMQVDRLSQALIESGAVDGKLVGTLQANLGTYLTRQYEVFRNAEWAGKVDPEVVNKFKAWLTGELTAKRAKVPGSTPVTPAEVDAITRSLLVNGTAAENPIAFLSKSKLGSKDLSILSERKDIPPELRALWGEYHDPLVNYANSIGKMSNLLANHLFLKRVAREGLGTLFSDAQGKNIEHSVEFAADGSDTLSPLNGLWTTPELKRAFAEVFEKSTVSEPMKWYMKALALAKFGKVVLSHTGQLRNFFSNVGLAVRNGYWRVADAPDAFAAIVRDTPEARERWRRLTELGVVGEELNYRDFQDTVKDALGGRELAFEKGPKPLDTIAARLFKGTKEFAEKLYRYGDSVWKVYAFENELARYGKAHPEWSHEELERHVAEIVRDTMPTYSKVPQGLKGMRKLPIAPFVSFQAEVVRTTLNTVRLALKELRDPHTAAIGATRLAGTVAAAAIPLALAAATRAMFGVTQDEEDAIRRFLPDYQKNSQLTYVGRDDKGQAKFFDLSKYDPHAYLADPVMAAFRGRKEPKKAGGAALEELTKPFTSEELLIRPTLDVARNQKEPGGHVYNPGDSTLNQAKDVGMNYLKAFTPGGWSPARRLVMAQAGVTEQKTGRGYEVPDEVWENTTGARIDSVRLEEQLTGKARGFNTARNDAAKMVNEMIKAKGAVTQDEVAAAATRTEEARKEAFAEFAKDLHAAEMLGMPRAKVMRILHDSGVDAADASALLRGIVPKYRPEVGNTPQERQRSLQVLRGGR